MKKRLIAGIMLCACSAILAQEVEMKCLSCVRIDKLSIFKLRKTTRLEVTIELEAKANVVIEEIYGFGAGKGNTVVKLIDKEGLEMGYQIDVDVLYDSSDWCRRMVAGERRKGVVILQGGYVYGKKQIMEAESVDITYKCVGSKDVLSSCLEANYAIFNGELKCLMRIANE